MTSVALAALLAAGQPPVVPPVGTRAVAPQPAVVVTPAARDTSAARRRERNRPPSRRLPVTPALAASAFASAEARTLLERARVARLAQDSALAAYEARTYQRISAGVGVRAFARERLLFRAENAARVTWARGRGATVEPTGSRAVVPVIKGQRATVDLTDATPLPYFPGRETLWFPSNAFQVAKAEVNDREFVHPLAAGSEAYYRYAAGGTASIRLPDGRVIALRELRVTPRRPDWRLFVGSFWFDAATGQLVRAAYRMSVDLDVWQIAGEDARREVDEALERARRDTSAAARAAVDAARREARDDDPPAFVKGMLSPLTATIGAITVEYGLYGGRFWLPRRNVAEGSGRAGFLRVPVSLEERFRYDRVDGGGAAGAATALGTPAGAPAPPAPPAVPRTAVDSALAAVGPGDPHSNFEVGVTIGDGDDVAVHGSVRTGERERAERIDSTLRAMAKNAADLTRRADSLRVAGDTARANKATRAAGYTRARAARIARREAACRTGAASYDAGARSRFEDDALPLEVRERRPCDPSTLASSPDLPKSPYDEGEALFGEAERDALLASLDFSLQPGWSPQPPVLRTGLAFARFNRVEGLSWGGSATSTLGLGYTTSATARLGVADLIPNAELALARSDGRSTLRAGAFHRLAVANDDWGNPLSLGASLAGALYGRDEGFYYRAWGLELGGLRPAPAGAWAGGWNPLRGATLGWRLFAERQRGATVEVRSGAFGPAYTPNVRGDRAVSLGASGDLARTFGADPAGARLTARVRGEGAWARYDDPVAPGLALGTSEGGRRSAPYARGMAEATVSRPLGPLAASVTGAAGAVAGARVPAQRLFYVGGLQTVRGQFAQPFGAGYAGTAFWLARAELGLDATGVRPVVFYDAGWAGPRERFGRPGRPLSGAGVGASFLDGLVRADLSRGIAPERRWRLDLSLDARF